ncbi:MAG: hypothetical protein VB089_05220 [Anaerolineaceae bacterium]|jgi:hypothetical protein|nr:hypothetical protein [Anaerolineaceae bacterium]
MTTANPLPIQLGAEQKSAPVMIYTTSGISWGEVVVKEHIRVSTWLRTNAAPEVVCLYNARTLVTTTAAGTPRPMKFLELHIHTDQILAFHLVPPAHDPVDYDPAEPNKKMEPVALMFGAFRADGVIRMSNLMSLARHVEVTRETFLPVYDAEIFCPSLPSIGLIRTPYVLIRQSTSLFGTKSA